MSTLSSLQSVCQKLKGEVEELHRSLTLAPKAGEILSDLGTLLGVREVEDEGEGEGSMEGVEETATPSPGPKKFNTPRTPNDSAKKKKAPIDFDAFPQTPTLAQLGISDRTLALVGEARPGKSRLGAISESDSDYKFSPSGSIAPSIVNSIPSTI